MQDALPLIVVCDWLPPSFGAVGQYEMARAQDAAKAGRAVTLIGLGESDLTEQVTVDGGSLMVVRIAANAPDKTSFMKRALWALAMNFRLLHALAHAANGRACEIKVTGSPPFLSYQVLLWRIFHKQHSITYRITDFYPETAIAAGKGAALRALIPIIHALRRRADRIEALSEGQVRRLVASGLAAERIVLVRDTAPTRFGDNVKPTPRPFSSGEAALLYSGNLGVAHDWRTFAEGYRAHIQTGSNRVRLWLNATGVGVAGLEAYCKAHGLPVHVSPPVALDKLSSLLLAADAHLILLGDPFWGYVFPSKIYGCLDSGRPCVFVGPEASDVHTLLGVDTRHFSVRQGDVQGVTAALERLVQQ